MNWLIKIAIPLQTEELPQILANAIAYEVGGKWEAGSATNWTQNLEDITGDKRLGEEVGYSTSFWINCKEGDGFHQHKWGISVNFTVTSGSSHTTFDSETGDWDLVIAATVQWMSPKSWTTEAPYALPIKYIAHKKEMKTIKEFAHFVKDTIWNYSHDDDDGFDDDDFDDDDDSHGPVTDPNIMNVGVPSFASYNHKFTQDMAWMHKISKKGIKYNFECTGAHSGQVDCQIVATLDDPYSNYLEAVGILKYSIFQGDYYINWIKVDEQHQRRGIATDMYHKLQEEAAAEGGEVIHGSSTPEGAAWRNSLTAQLELPGDLYNDMQLLHEEDQWTRAVSTPGSLVRHHKEGWTGKVIELRGNPVNGGVVLVEHEMRDGIDTGSTVQRFYPALVLSPVMKLTMPPKSAQGFMHKNANIDAELAKQYSDKYVVLSSNLVNFRRQLLQENPPQTYQDQLLMDAQVAKRSIELYEELLLWMKSQIPLANQDVQFKSKWQDAIDGTQSRIQDLHEEIAVWTEPFKISDHDVNEVIEWALDNDVDIIPILEQYDIDYYEVKFPLTKVLRFDTDQSWIYESGSLQEAHTWVDEAEPYEYFEAEPDDYFWSEDLRGFKVYHATTSENAKSIMQDGLMEMDETRGLSNRSTGPAVFTSENPHDIDAYGEVTFEVDIGLMQSDGYTVPVSREEPVEEQELKHQLARHLELEDYHWEVDSDMSPSTLIFHGPIPSKYINIFD